VPIHTTDAIVLRTIDYSETSLIVWCFTRELGRVHVIAKGARRARSPFEGALEPLVRGELVFYRKAKPEGLDIAKEFDLQDLHLRLRGDLDRLHRGLYVGELLTELSEQEVPAPEAFDAAAEALARLSHEPRPALDLVLVRCQLRLLASAGLHPVLDRCARCGGPPFAEGVDEAWFGPAQGGALCATHADRDAGTASVSRPVLRRLLAVSLGRDVPADPALDLEVRRRLDLFLSWHLGREVRMSRWLRPIAVPAATRQATQKRSRAVARPR
jgi:DNA repair protein RecO (recombination protein O)